MLSSFFKWFSFMILTDLTMHPYQKQASLPFNQFIYLCPTKYSSRHQLICNTACMDVGTQ